MSGPASWSGSVTSGSASPRPRRDRQPLATAPVVSRLGVHACSGRGFVRQRPRGCAGATSTLPAGGSRCGDHAICTSTAHQRRSRRIRILRTVEPTLPNPQRAQAIIPVPGECLGFDRVATRVREHRLVWRHVQRLYCLEHARHAGEQLHLALVTTALAVGVKIPWLEAQTGVSYETLRRQYGEVGSAADRERVAPLRSTRTGAVPGQIVTRFTNGWGTSTEKAPRCRRR